MAKISVVINTLNEEKNISRAISSVKGLADEVVVVDMESTDKTREIAESMGAKVFTHKYVGYVEPTRNFAISKAKGEWILILDADERISEKLIKRIKRVVEAGESDYVRIPRKNIIFGKWIRHALWWPDYQIRLFRKGKVSWNEIIHSVPVTTGVGVDLPAKESLAIFHNNYKNLSDYLRRMDRYSSIQAELLIQDNYKFIWKDLINKPVREFIGRYFAGKGFKDGAHGLSLSILQAFSEFITYMKVWDKEKYLEQTISEGEVISTLKPIGKEASWWLDEVRSKSGGIITKLTVALKRKLNG